MYCIVLYCTALYCTVLYYAMLYCTIQARSVFKTFALRIGPSLSASRALRPHLESQSKHDNSNDSDNGNSNSNNNTLPVHFRRTSRSPNSEN